MRYFWLIPLPPEVAYAVATLLIVLCGIALMLQWKGIAFSLFLAAVLLLALPLFDPAIDSAVDTTIDVGDYYFHEWPWWVVAGVSLLILLLLFRAVLAFVFNKEVADRATGNVISYIARPLFPVLLIVGAIAGVVYYLRSLFS